MDHITSLFLCNAGFPGPPGVQGSEGVRGPRGYAGLSGETTDYSVRVYHTTYSPTGMWYIMNVICYKDTIITSFRRIDVKVIVELLPTGMIDLPFSGQLSTGSNQII